MPPPGEILLQARRMMSAGDTAEAQELLRRLERDYPTWNRHWETRILRATCRETLLSKSPPVKRESKVLRVAQVLLFEGETIEEITANL